MRLDDIICLGGRWNKREILGIKYNGYIIFPHIESEIKPEELYNEYELSTYNSSAFNMGVISKINCLSNYSLKTDWGDRSTGDQYTSSHTYGSGSGVRNYVISSNGALHLDLSYNRDEEPDTECTYIKAIKHVRPDIIDGSKLFSYFCAVTTPNLYLPETTHMTNMHEMFRYCCSLTTLDLSSFKTNKVTDMGGMFENCHELTELNLSNFNMDKVVDTDYMFYNCNKLHTLKLNNCNHITINKIITSSHFPTGDIGTTRKIYVQQSNVVGLTAPDGWEFTYCKSSGEIIIERPKSYIPGEFERNKDLIEATTMVTTEHDNLHAMFYGCNNLTTINGIEQWDTSNVTDMSYMFSGCYNLTSLDVSNFNTSKVTNMCQMFSGCCFSLEKIDLYSFDTNNVTDMSYMFEGCYSLTELNSSIGFNSRNTTNMQGMFKGCIELPELDLSSFYSSKVTNMRDMFCGCYYLEKLDLRNFRINNYGSVDSTNLFGVTGTNDTDPCSNLKEIRLDNCNFETLKVIIEELPIRNSDRGAIYCKEVNLTYNDETLTAPDGWDFVFVD